MNWISARRKYFLLLLILISLFFAGNIKAQQKYDAQTTAKIAEVENGLVGNLVIEGDKPGNIVERMKLLEIPGLSIAVIKNYKVDWVKSYGVMDADSRKPVTNESLFQAASISKSLNRVGAMKLVQDKKIDPNTDINVYLKSWTFPYNELSSEKKINLFNLLSHTAGLTVHGFPGYEPGAAIPGVNQVLDGLAPANTKAVRPQFAPGSRVQYSGGGTTISQVIISDVSGLPYHRYMNEKILAPMGMTMSFFDQPAPASRQAQLCTGHNGDGKPIRGKWHIYPEQAAAGLWTNPTDLAKYIIETQLAWNGRSAKVLSQEITKQRLTPVMENAAAGVFISEKGGAHYFEHGGSNAGFRSQYTADLENGNGVVIMVNSDNGSIMNEIINSVAVAYKWKDYYKPDIRKKVDVPDSTLKSYVGVYRLAPQFTITISFDGKTLWAQGTNQPSFPLIPESQTVFFTKVIDAKIEFVAPGMVLRQNGQQIKGERINSGTGK